MIAPTSSLPMRIIFPNAKMDNSMKDYLDEAKKNLGDFDVNQASQVMSAMLDNKQEISAVLAKDKKE